MLFFLKKIKTPALGAFFVTILFFLGANSAFAAVNTWSGAVNSNWSNTGNWSLAHVPTTADVATFDNTCTNCNVTVDTGVMVSGFNILSTYTGIISFGSQTISVFSFFNAVGNNAVNPGTSTFTFLNGGNGNIGGTTTFYNLTFPSYSGYAYTIASGGDLIVNNTLSLYAVHISGPGFIEAKGDVVSGCWNQNYGAVAIYINGTGNQNLSGSMPGNSSLAINKPSGTLFFLGSITLGMGNLIYTKGTIDIGTSSITIGGGTIFGNITFYDVYFTYVTGMYSRVSSGTTITVNHSIVSNSMDSNSVGTIEVKGNILSCSGGSPILIDGTGSQTISATSCNSSLTINKPSGSISLLNGVTFGGSVAVTSGAFDMNGYDATFNGALTINGGTFFDRAGTLTVASTFSESSGTFSGESGAITIKGAFTLSGGVFTSTSGTLTFNPTYNTASNGLNITLCTISGGTFNHNNGTLSVATIGTIGNNRDTFTINAQTSLTLYNVLMNILGDGYSEPNYLTTTGTPIVIANNFTDTSGSFSSGAFQVQGNVIIRAGAGGGAGTLTMTGTKSQTYTNSGGTSPTGAFTVNKTSGSISFLSNETFGSALTVTSGTFDMNGYSITIPGLSIASGGILKNVGSSGTLMLSGNAVNNGSLIMRTNNSCGNADSLAITSNNTNVRAWTGTGTYSLQDVSISYQSVSPGKTIYSSTLSNTTGFTNGASCPSSGVYTSSVIDTVRNAGFTTVTYVDTLPTGETLQVDVGSGNTATPDGSWTWINNVSSGASISGLGHARYAQYRITASIVFFSSITINYTQYPDVQYLISSPYDTLNASNVLSDVFWNEDANLPSGTSVGVSLRTGDTLEHLLSASWSSPLSATETGCSKNSTTVTCLGRTSPILANYRTASGNEWFQYKIILGSTGLNTPTFSDITIKYVVNAPPELQNVTASENPNGTVSISYDVRDRDTTTGSVTPGSILPSFEYSTNGGVSWTPIVADLSSGATSTKSVSTTVDSDGNSLGWTTYSTVWVPKNSLNGLFSATTQIRVTANDSEMAFNTVQLASLSFLLDIKNPIPGINPIQVAATTFPAQITLSATDDSALFMKVGNDSSLAGYSWVPYSASATLSLSSMPATVYAQFQDAFGNTSPVVSVTTPQTPQNIMYKDISDSASSNYRLFVSWNVVPSSGNGFGYYRVYRSTTGFDGSYALFKSVSGRSVNYMIDGESGAFLDPGMTYYYKVCAEDINGNTSSFSAVVSHQPSGQGGTDTVAPAIRSISITPSTESATVDWFTDEISTSIVTYCVTSCDTNPHLTQSVPSYSLNHEVVISGLEPNTVYDYYVTSADLSLNSGDSTPNPRNFTTLSGAKISKVSVPSVTNTTAKIDWTTDISVNGTVYYSAGTFPSASNQNTKFETTSGTSHEVTLTNLAQSQIYYFYIAAGNGENRNTVNGANEYFYFYTANDTSAPVITNVSPLTIADVSSVIFWNTDKPANSFLQWGTTTGNYIFSNTKNTPDTNHSLVMNSLSPSIVYYYRVASGDANGNTSTSTEYSFTTLAKQYGESAPIITGPQANPTAETSEISWTTDKVTTTSVTYCVSSCSSGTNLNQTVTGFSLNHDVVVSGLEPNTMYEYFVTSSDNFSNTTVSDKKTFTTVNGPKINSVSIVAVTNTTAIITWTTNISAIGGVHYVADVFPNGSNETSEIETSTGTSHKITLSGLTKGKTYYFYVTSGTSEDRRTLNSVNSYYSFFTTTNTGAPLITNVGTTTVIDIAAAVTWDTDVPSTSFWEYGTVSGTYSSSTSLTTLNINHRLAVNDFSPSTTYYYNVVSSDADGNTSTSTEYTFTTLEKQYSQTSLNAAVTAGSSSGGGGGGGGVAQYLYDSVVANLASTTQKLTEMSTQFTTTLNELNGIKTSVLGIKEGENLAPKEILKIVSDKFLSLIKTYQQGGTLDLNQGDITPVVNTLRDLASTIPPPIVQGAPEIKTTSTGATISWTTDKEANSIISYAKTGEYDVTRKNPYTSQSGMFDVYTKEHSVLLENLTPSTDYHFQIKSSSPSGTPLETKDFTFTTGVLLPEISNASAETTNGNSTFAWDTNVPTNGSVKYTPTINGKTNPVNAVTLGKPDYVLKHTITLDMLKPGTTYEVMLVSSDQFGNIATRNMSSFTTGKDTTPPAISSVKTQITTFSGSAGKVQSIIFWNTDESATSQVLYQEGATLPETPAVSTQKTIDMTMEHTVVIIDWKPNSIYTFRVASVDSSGNNATSKDFTVKTPQQKVSVIDLLMNNFSSTFGWTKNMKI